MLKFIKKFKKVILLALGLGLGAAGVSNPAVRGVVVDAVGSVIGE